MPSLCVEGVDGYPNLNFSNPYPSTGGKDMEDDDSYRERIRTWASKLVLGSRACLVDYLDNYPGLDDYRLVPRFDGPGTLKVIADCIPNEFEALRDGIQENCMLYTDEEVVIEQVGTHVLQNLGLVIHLDEEAQMNRSYEELAELVDSQCHTFIEGGVDLEGNQVRRLRLGKELDPSRLLSFIQGQFSEIANIRSTNVTAPVHIGDAEKLVLDSVSIEFE